MIQYGTDLNKANDKLRQITSLYHVCHMWLCRDEPECRAFVPYRFFEKVNTEDYYLNEFDCKQNASLDIHKATNARKDAFSQLFKQLIDIMNSLKFEVHNDEAMTLVG
jgi:hypothetical protein